ncbi:hypothetical protein Hanom_Chr00s107802g01806471 [Helianthus anomalus]
MFDDEITNGSKVGKKAECRILTPYDGESNYKHVGRNGRSNGQAV